MKTLYLQCSMGAAGDMIMAALLELYPSKEDFLHQMNHLGLKNLGISSIPAEKCGIHGTRIQVLIQGKEEESLDIHPTPHHHHDDHRHEDHLSTLSQDSIHFHDHTHHAHFHSLPSEDSSHNDALSDHHHTHGSFSEICTQIQSLPLPPKVIEDTIGVYTLLAQAEAKVHGSTIDHVHFHEVGTLDAIADIVGVCLLIHLLDPKHILCSPIATGQGHVKAAHGILPVPAPATAILLTDMEIYHRSIQGELCTPTGAALLKYFVHAQSPMPQMKLQTIGYGMGKKDFSEANCLRVFLGEQKDSVENITAKNFDHLHHIPLLQNHEDLLDFIRKNQNQPFEDKAIELSCNIDDMTGEDLSFAIENLFESSALDITVENALGKKSRPVFVLVCLCHPKNEDDLTSALFKWTSTKGIRRKEIKRRILISAWEKIATPYGHIRMKHSVGWGIHKAKPEHQDLLDAAKKHGVTIETIRLTTGSQ